MMKKTTRWWLCMAPMFFTGLAIAQGEPAAGKQKSEMCAGCHGEDGNAAVPIFPKLAGQHASYLARQMADFKAKKRIDQTMNAMAETLSEADIQDISAWYAAARIKPESADPNPVGEKIFKIGIAAKGVPACASCHGPNGSGNPSAAYPAVAGQYAAYISKTLGDYRTGERSNDPNSIMRSIAGRLTQEEADAVAEYASALK